MFENVDYKDTVPSKLKNKTVDEHWRKQKNNKGNDAGLTNFNNNEALTLTISTMLFFKLAYSLIHKRGITRSCKGGVIVCSMAILQKSLEEKGTFLQILNAVLERSLDRVPHH